MTRRALIALLTTPVIGTCLIPWDKRCNQRDLVSAIAPAQDEQDAWDAEMERDFAPGGAGEAWLKEIEADFRAGKFTDWDEAKKELGI